MLGPRLASMHNLRFILRLMADMRAAIAAGRFDRFRADFLAAYRPTDESRRQTQKHRWGRRTQRVEPTPGRAPVGPPRCPA